MRSFAARTLLCFVVAAPLVAKADVFTITGQGQEISFALPSSPSPSTSQTGVGFVIQDVTVYVNGTKETTDVGFGAGGPLGQPDLFIGTGESVDPSTVTSGSPSYGVFFGPQLYTGAEAMPTFDLGLSASITNVDDAAEVPTGDYTVSIGPGSSVTPEPSGVLLLGSGLMGMAGLLRRRLA